jgi:hypothetical protein
MGEQNPRAATWQNLQDYFTEKFLVQKQYLQATAKQLWFKDAALVAQELAAAEVEGKITAMMFALLQEQHKAQLEAMVAANKQTMDAMLEHMNALITGQGKAADKPTARVPTSNPGNAPNTANCKNKVCTNCRKLIFHKPQTCYELESNASKRNPGWKSSKNASATV